MSLMFDNDGPALARPRRGQRLAAVMAIALTACSWALLSNLAAENTRPVQSVAWVFGPAPVAQPVQ